MALEEQFEQLCFGTSMPKLDVSLGLYLSPDVLYLSEVQLSGGRPKVTHLVRLPLPPSTGPKESKTMGSLNTEFLADSDRLSGILTKALTEIRWRSRNVVTTFSHHFSILRYFAFPAIDRRFWKSAIPAEAKKYIPIPFTSLSYDFQVVNQATDSRRQGALFGVTDRKNLASVEALAARVGLTLVGMELAPCSVERLWDSIDPAAASVSYAQVHFDGGDIRILVSESGIPIFFREVALSGEASMTDRRKVDLGGCLDFTRKQLGGSVPASVRLSGQNGDIESWRQALSQDSGQAVSYLDVDKSLGLRGCQWGGYAAIGAALRHLADTPIRLDLMNAGRVSDQDRRAAFTILKLSAMVAGFLALVGIFRFSSLYYQTGTLRALQRKVAVLDAFRGKRSEEIEAKMVSIQAKLNFFSSVTIRRVPLTHVLASVAEAIPSAAWITDLDYLNPLSAGGGSRAGRTIILSGRTIGGTRAAEQDVTFQFSEGLNKNAVFKEAFPTIEPAVEAPVEDSSGAELKGPDAELRHTSFKISCSSKAGKI